jgi:hypothetical protein
VDRTLVVVAGETMMGQSVASVYVDDAFVEGDWGKWTGGGHLQADTSESLHDFAARLGLRREWFQSRPGRPERDHYDVTRSKRDEAILLGAIPEAVEDGTARRKAARLTGRGRSET